MLELAKPAKVDCHGGTYLEFFSMYFSIRLNNYWPVQSCTLYRLFWNQRSLVFLTEMFFWRAKLDGFRVSNQTVGWHKMPHSSPIFMKKVILCFRHFPKPMPHFSRSLLTEEQVSDGLGSWKAGSAMYEANLCKGTCDLELWMKGVEIVSQSHVKRSR